MALIRCPECDREVSDIAKNCPHCGFPLHIIENVTEEPQKSDRVHYSRPNGTLPKREEKPKKKKTWIWIVLGIFVLFVLIGLSGGSSEESEEALVENKNIEETEVKETVIAKIEYNAYTVDEMVNVLNENALKAEKTFQDQYVEITGRLSTIDSDGNYISLNPLNDEWAIIGVQCYIQNEEQLEQVLEMKVDDTIVLRGKIKSIGEIMGYSLDIDSID